MSCYILHLRASGRSGATLESYRGSLGWLGNRIGNEIVLPAITSDGLNEAMVALLAGGAGPALSEVTGNRHRSAWRAFFGWAQAEGYIAINPARQLHLAWVDALPTMPISLTETREFLLTIRRSGDPLRLRDEALFSLYAMTGLRRAEALSLNFGDFDRQTGTLRLRQGKGRRVRIVPVAVPLCSLLDRLRGDDSKEGKLFPGRGAGRGLTVRQAHGRFEKWKRVTGLRPQLTIHSFRVGFATALHEQTSDAMTIARILGHRDLRMTLRYTSTSVEGMRRAIGIVGSAVGAGV